MSRRLEVKQWYSDAPFPKARKNPSLWTNTFMGHYIEPSYGGTPEAKWEEDMDAPVETIHMEFLQSIKPGYAYDFLRIRTTDDEEFITNRITKGTRKRDSFRFKPKGSDDRETIRVLDIERIDVVQEP